MRSTLGAENRFASLQVPQRMSIYIKEVTLTASLLHSVCSRVSEVHLTPLSGVKSTECFVPPRNDEIVHSLIVLTKNVDANVFYTLAPVNYNGSVLDINTTPELLSTLRF